MISPKVIILCAFIVHLSTSHPAGSKSVVDNLGIIGGHNVSIEAAPYMASLFDKDNNQFTCGATIIDKNFVLTAAHCCLFITSFEIRVGSTEYLKGGEVTAPANVTIHELFLDEMPDYDICVIKLNDSLKFGSTIDKVILADDSVELHDGLELTAYGWGLTEETFNFNLTSNYLREVNVPFVSECNDMSLMSNISSRMICAGAKNKSTYHGDSGGPLVYENAIQVGITSFKTMPFEGVTVYVKVAALLPWIHETMAKLLLD